MTANARLLGEYQSDAFQNFTGEIRTGIAVVSGAFMNGISGSNISSVGNAIVQHKVVLDPSMVARTSVETRSISTALTPFICV